MRSDDTRSRRDTYLGIAAATMAVAYLSGASANITYFPLDRITFLGSTLVAARWLLQVCGFLVLAIGFAVIAVTFFGSGDARGPRFGRGALVLAGAYGVILVAGVLSLFQTFGNPDQLLPLRVQISLVTQVASYLPALVAALLAATAFGRPQAIRDMKAAARNRRLGWASIGFAVEFALLLLSRLVTGAPILATLNLWSLAPLLALAAAVVAAVGFFGVARAYRLSSPSPLPRREGFLAIAAVLFLLYRVFDLTHLMRLASWLWQLEVLALAAAAFCAAIGFAVSRRSLPGRDRSSLIIGDD